jgi:hypothetical protein
MMKKTLFFKLFQAIFAALANLTQLNLAENQIEDINGLLTAQMNLRHLNLSANRLHWFDYAFVPNSLSHLDLHDNLIDSVENYYSLKEGFQLQYLDASQNRFDPIGYNLFLLSSHWLKSLICSCSLLIG